MDVVVTAGEIVSKFVREQNGQERQGEGQAADQRERLPIQQRERANEFVPGNGLILCVGGGEVRTRYKTCAERQ